MEHPIRKKNKVKQCVDLKTLTDVPRELWYGWKDMPNSLGLCELTLSHTSEQTFKGAFYMQDKERRAVAVCGSCRELLVKAKEKCK